MNVLIVLMPLALALGLVGLLAFFWCLRTDQFNDLEGSGWRVLRDDDLPPPDEKADRHVTATRK